MPRKKKHGKKAEARDKKIVEDAVFGIIPIARIIHAGLLDYVRSEHALEAQGLALLTSEQKALYHILKAAHKFPTQTLLKLSSEVDDQNISFKLLELLFDYDTYPHEDFIPNPQLNGYAAEALVHYGLRYIEAQKLLAHDRRDYRAIFGMLKNMGSWIKFGDYFMTTSTDPESPYGYLESRAYKLQNAIALRHVNTITLRGYLSPYLACYVELLYSKVQQLINVTTYGFSTVITSRKLASQDLFCKLMQSGFKTKIDYADEDRDYNQHIWVHPENAITVRVKDNGRFSVGLLSENVISDSGAINKSRLTEGAHSEALKISGCELVPARRSSEKGYAPLWYEAEDPYANRLLDSSHFSFDNNTPPYFNFDAVTAYLDWKPTPKYELAEWKKRLAARGEHFKKGKASGKKK